MLANPSNVESKEDLAKFVTELCAEFRNAPERWENNDLASFLEAMGAWIIDMDGCYVNRGETPPSQRPEWKTLADILRAATMYE